MTIVAAVFLQIMALFFAFVAGMASEEGNTRVVRCGMIVALVVMAVSWAARWPVL